MSDPQTDAVRRFNRAVTRRIGVLTDNYLGRDRPWAESRLIFEVGPGGADVRTLRERLALDSGYLSRLLRSLEAQGLVVSRPTKDDARVRRVSLTAKGVREWKVLEARSDDIASMLLAPLSEGQRQRLLAAMGDVVRLLSASAVTIEPVDPDSADARNCIDAYVHELEQRLGVAFDPTRGPTAHPAELTPPKGVLLLARLDGAPVGCIGLKVIGAGIGEIKRMWVDPSVRGLGIARRLLAAAEAQAAGMALRRLRLDTSGRQQEAQALYRAHGYREIAAYNDNPYADYWFEKRLPGKRTAA